MNAYPWAKAQYAGIGVDTDQAIEALLRVPISMHCWQGDDVGGFDRAGQALSGGIQATGNYPGKARTPKELMDDIQKALSLIPGKHRLSLHASYAIFEEGEWVDRDALRPEHFAPWIAFAKEQGIGIDFNPTYFSHPMVRDNMTLASGEEAVRAFWVRHSMASRRIASEIARELGSPVLHNIWIPDGMKDYPADRLGPRLRLRQSLDEIYAEKLPGVIDCVESKLFGIGLEAYTVGSSEFYLLYAATHPGVYVLLDNGHFHPQEYVSDKLPSLLAYFDKVPLHVTRPMRWDSDHVVLYEDELREIAKEIVRNDALDKVMIGLDFFDASINRVAAWVVGMRNMQRALLYALLLPHQMLKELQDRNDTTRLMVLTEAYKTYPIGPVWEEALRRAGVPEGESWFEEVKAYEQQVLQQRD